MDKPARYSCHSLHLPGGTLPDDKAWANLPSLQLVDVVTGESPFLSTQCQLARDDARQLLFVRFQGEDDEIHSSFRLLDEPLYRQDVFELFLCEDGDLTRYKELECSPWDVHFDGLIHFPQGGRPKLDVDWDIEGWTSQTVYDAQQHRITSLWALPYAAFSRPPKTGESWRMGVFRIDHSRRGQSLQAWQATGQPNFHVPERFGYLDFKA